MAQAAVEKEMQTDSETGRVCVYEIGYHISPSVKEEDVEKAVGQIRSAVEAAGGSFIAEGAPSLIKLSYEMSAVESGKNVLHDRAYFGWLKFECPSNAAENLNNTLKLDKNLLRHILFETVREDTRAKIKMATLREVRRTDTIKSTPKRAEETAAPVSEADLDKAIEGLTTE